MPKVQENCLQKRINKLHFQLVAITNPREKIKQIDLHKMIEDYCSL